MSAVGSGNREHSFCHWNLTEFIHQYWDLSVSRSSEQIKFKLSSGRRRSLLVLGPTASQGMPLVWDQWNQEVLLKPCSLASLAQLMLCIPFLASPVSFVGELYQPRMQTSSIPYWRWGFAWPYLSWESHEGGFFSNDIWDGFQLLLRSGKGQRPLLPSSVSNLEAELPDQVHSVFQVREI